MTHIFTKQSVPAGVQVDCPRCGATYGQHCRSGRRKMAIPHLSRMKAAYRLVDAYSAKYNPTGKRDAFEAFTQALQLQEEGQASNDPNFHR